MKTPVIVIENDYINVRLSELSTPELRKFNAKLIPNISNILGVRVPALRLLAKEIAHDDWRKWLPQAENTYMEHVMLQGLVIGYAQMQLQEHLDRLEWFVPKIDNWAVCDSVVGTLKFVSRHQEEVWQFLQPYLYSQKEFEQRFAIVMLLDYFVCETYLQRLFIIFDTVENESYYVRMAIAWAVSVCAVKFPEPTFNYLSVTCLSDWTYRMALRKIRESYRISDDYKKRYLLREPCGKSADDDA